MVFILKKSKSHTSGTLCIWELTRSFCHQKCFACVIKKPSGSLKNLAPTSRSLHIFIFLNITGQRLYPASCAFAKSHPGPILSHGEGLLRVGGCCLFGWFCFSQWLEIANGLDCEEWRILNILPWAGQSYHQEVSHLKWLSSPLRKTAPQACSYSARGNARFMTSGLRTVTGEVPPEGGWHHLLSATHFVLLSSHIGKQWTLTTLCNLGRWVF